MKPQKLIILIGGNEGDVRQTFSRVLPKLQKRLGPVLAVSSLYRTAAWGPVPQPDFLNQALVFETVLSPLQCLRAALAVEKEFGRRRELRYGPRSIDIDIIYYGNHVLKTAELTVPHPEISKRRFVLVPLNEICPAFVHPFLKVNNRRLLENCTDPLEVFKLN